jgi:hypothetical protein
MMNKAQADIAYGFIATHAPRSRVLRVLADEQRVRQYAIGGRLGDSIRERQGMAYYVSSSLDANVGEGRWRPRRREPGQRRSRDRLDRRGDRAAGRRRADAQELDESRRI